MGKALGIDYGTKRTGIAISDHMQIIATGLTTIPTHKLDQFILELVAQDDISCFVVGDPKDLKARPTNSTSHIHGFINRLQQRFPKIPVYQIDERFTSKIAKESILQSGVSKKIRRDKRLVDKVSATIILQSYINNR